jgi:ER membrane protein complex subunit 7
MILTRKPSIASGRLLAAVWMIVWATYGATCQGSSTPTTTIEGRLQFPDQTPFNITTKIALNFDEFTTYSQADGSFHIYHVPPGIHVLNVLSTTHHFSQIKIQLLADDMSHPKCLEYYYPGAQKQVVAHPLVLTAIATYEYFEERAGFSFTSILRNPMIILMMFSVGLMLLMPKMMEGLEPEERERMKQQMEMQQDPTKMLGQLFGGFGATEPEKPPKIKAKKAN